MFTTIYDKPGYDDYLELEPLGTDTAGDQRLTSLDIHKSQRFCREEIPIVCNSCWTLPCGNFRIAMENWMLYGCFTYQKMSLCIVHLFILYIYYLIIHIRLYSYIYILYIVRLFFLATSTVYPFGSLKSPKRPKAHRSESSLKRSCRG